MSNLRNTNWNSSENSVTNPRYWTNLRDVVVANGYDPVPLTPGKKHPTAKGWPKIDYSQQPLRKNHAGVGIKTKNTPTIDVDVTDPTALSEISTLLDNTLDGHISHRVGNHGFVVMCRLEGRAFKKLNTGKYVDHNGNLHGLEILATGQQFAALHIHPETGEQYAWDNGDPSTISWADLPPLSLHTAEVLVQAVVKIFLALGWKPVNNGAAPFGGGLAQEGKRPASVPELIAQHDPVLEYLHNKGCVLNEVEPGKWNGVCLFAPHNNGDDKGAVYWQVGHEGRTRPYYHCSHDGCSSNKLEQVIEHAKEQGVALTIPSSVGSELVRLGVALAARGVDSVVNYPKGVDEFRQYVSLYILPDLSMNKNGPAKQQPPTIENVKAVMRAIGADIRYNLMTHREEVMLPWAAPVEENALNYGYNIIIDACLYADISDRTSIRQKLDTIAMENCYHPFRDYVASAPWDGKSRLDALLDTLTLADPAERTIARIYLHRFLLQIIEATHADKPGQLRGLFLLVGKQGGGKTKWFRRLAGDPQFFKEGQSVGGHGYADRDFIMASMGYVLVELGELDATFRKSDIAQLKALLTREENSFRAPYAAKPSKYPRCEVYCGTVNDVQVLVDITGNTRFWPVEVNKCDFNHGVDMQQVYAEYHQIWLTGEQYWLTEEEEASRAAWESKYRQVNHIDEVISGYFEKLFEAGPEEVEWKAMTATDVAIMFNLNPNQKTLNEIGICLKRLTGKNHSGDKRIDGKKRAWLLPMPTGKGLDSPFFLQNL